MKLSSSTIFLFFILLGTCLNGQEFTARVSVNSQKTGNQNLQVFRTLERALTEFINTNKWTTVDYRSEERIGCSFFITINQYENNSFSGTLQVQATRAIFGSSYTSTILNINDKQFGFEYFEFQPLNYNPNQFDSNLISVITYYLYTILGIDADSFSDLGGTKYFEQAKNIAVNAQGSNRLGWNLQDGQQTRFRLNDDLLSDTYAEFRKAMYQYHRKGLDAMHNKLKEGKKEVQKSFNLLNQMHNRRPNSYLMRVFFDAKAEEIAAIFSGGPAIKTAKTIGILQRIAPTYGTNWEKIKY